ncbi:MAG: 2-aminoethylphosphonate--pyruvate transaminase [Hyphomicrobiaceae bacterium]
MAKRGASETGDPILLTPGPLTTARDVKQAMLHDWGSRDAAFLKINREVMERLPEIAGAKGRFVTVPVQGSGTFAVEAMLTTFVPSTGKVLVLVNGAYGSRARRILEISKRSAVVHETPEDTPPDLVEIDRILAADPAITHVFAVHCETTSGILNPINEIGRLARQHGRCFLLDSMSAFGALPLDQAEAGFAAVAASSNKCIEGVPGLGFVICDPAILTTCKDNATTLVLDLHDQWQNFERTGQYRFTPPIHVIVAFHKALETFFAEGGQAGRGGRYARNGRVLCEGMEKLGFRPLLTSGLQAPIIYTFHMPKDPRFVFQTFYDALKDRGYVIYPGKLTVADSFRIGCIGAIDTTVMCDFLDNVAEVLKGLGIGNFETAA